MAGSWPEDEYDVAEPPLSRGDYKSQVFFNLDEQAIPVIVGVAAEDASDTDFESLESDESGWGDGIDDTMASDIDIEVVKSPSPTNLGGFKGGMLRELFEEIDRENEGRRGAIKEVEIETRSEDDEALREEILEGPEEAAGSEIESAIATRAESELRGQIEEIFRMELGEEADRVFGSAPESQTPPLIGPTAVEAADKKATTQPFIPTLSIEEIIPIPDELKEPPPIPSRSPSRPGTSMANRRPFNDAPGILPPAQPCDSSLSLPPARPTGSSMSSPRSSRFFEDLGDPAATTATSIEIPQENPISSPLPPTSPLSLPMSPPPLPPSRQASDESSATEPLKKKSKKQSSFFSFCGLGLLFKRNKSKEPKGPKAPVPKKVRTISISSLVKR